jgi:ribosomal protein L10
MKKDEKTQFIDALAEKLTNTNNFYLADISDLNVETTSRLRRIVSNETSNLKWLRIHC